MENSGIAPAENGTIVRHGLCLYLAIAITLALLLSLFFLVKSKAFAFVDIGSDTFFCFYPLQVAVSKQLHQLHTITWSFDLGLGGFLGTLVDPMWLVTGWLPESWQLALRLPMFVLRLLLAGAFIYGYLRLIGFDALFSVMGALCYSFSTYGLINAQWEVLHGTEFVQLAAYLYFLERYLRTGSRWPAIGAGIVVGLGHPLGLYMFALLTLVYGVIKLSGIERTHWLSLIGSFFRFAGWCVCGIVLTAPLLFPEIYYLFDSPRVSGEYANFRALLGSLFAVNGRTILSSEIAGLVGKDLLGTGSNYGGWGNYFEAPGFYVGLLPLLCITQLLGPYSNRRERLMCLAGGSITALYLVFPAVRYAVYGFGHTGFRFSTVWISVLLLVLGLCGLRRAWISGVWRTGLFIAIAGILCIMLVAMVGVPAVVSIEHVLRVCAFLGLYAALLPGAIVRERRPLSFHFLLAACCCELLLFAVPPVIERNAVGSDGTSTVGGYEDGSKQALALIREHDRSDTFYRVEKTFDSVFLDDALIQDYPGTKSYAFNSASITRFVDHLGLPRTLPSPSYVSSMTRRRSTIDLVGVKYVLTKNRSLDIAAGMTYVDSAGDVDVYRNENARGFAQFFDSISAESAIDELPVEQRDVSLLSTVAVADPAPITAQIATLNRVNTEQSGRMPTAALTRTSDVLLEGQVQTLKARILLVSMPFDRGWTAHLDGEIQQLIRADFGLSALVIPPGEHRLALNYSPPGRRLGAWLALALMLLLAMRLWMDRAADRRIPNDVHR